MNANLECFGLMDQRDANSELKLNLSIVKQQAEAVLHEMDLLTDRCSFDPGNGTDKFERKKEEEWRRNFMIKRGMTDEK